jgi:hypothetical protein
MPATIQSERAMPAPGTATQRMIVDGVEETRSSLPEGRSPPNFLRMNAMETNLSIGLDVGGAHSRRHQH